MLFVEAMLLPAVILALSQPNLSTEDRTLSSNEYTEALLQTARVPARPRDPFEHRFSLELRLGVATPTGALGVAGEFSFLPGLGVGCGVGTNVYGPEYACWFRARAILRTSRAVTLASGVSTAPFRQNEATAGGVFGPILSAGEGAIVQERTWKHAAWANVDLGYESRRNALLFRTFGGLAALLNPNDGVVEPTSAPDTTRVEQPVNVLIYAGIGVGFYE